ncbi:DNA protecting protein DprA [Hoylesella oralis ATCC 33269]|uniref:DNA protecting protein DprA n=1 Tax=Hoylesella oralis ATCC 33269 TaxID=873533 RepID=E7RN15_9BACT|nr:DNA-processing protein DprA [Hoylesella oralis]EFZ38146.1 DNA protecting protein DprA [Hoylesella oralis ATCC 33269]SHF37648.1 DNA processing protein [Hoylesella oralis]
MDTQEIINTIALTRINYFYLAGLLELYRRLGSATAAIEHRNNILDVVPDASPKLVKAFKELSEPLKRAETELEWDMKNGVVPLCMNDERYPQRLKECDDAPLMLFYKGNANLNQAKIIAIVGTRRCTMYGQDLIRRFTAELKQHCPNVLIVSGLAYGVDINAHRYALQNAFQTVGVLAHGLDDLYPPRHRQTAEEMLLHGGLLSEFLTNTNADKVNFVRRNRIVAGIADAVILVESASQGGGLITTRIARDYNRDVFAFPGPVGAPYSEGCNNLIRDNGAGLISNAYDFVKAMGWEGDAKLQQTRKSGIERELFPNLTDEELQIVKVLAKTNDLQINMLSVQSNLPIARLTALLFSMEMKGVVKTLAGGVYHLLA